jgi:hypothetical protein
MLMNFLKGIDFMIISVLRHHSFFMIVTFKKITFITETILNVWCMAGLIIHATLPLVFSVLYMLFINSGILFALLVLYNGYVCILGCYAPMCGRQQFPNLIKS